MHGACMAVNSIPAAKVANLSCIARYTEWCLLVAQSSETDDDV